jgi:Predicted membrane protein
MEAVVWIFAIIGLGMLAGFFLRFRRPLLVCCDKVSVVAVCGLLFLLGAGLGNNDALFARLSTIGYSAALITFAACAGSVLFILLPQRAFATRVASRISEEGRKKKKESSPEIPDAQGHDTGSLAPVLASARILACFVAGMIVARLDGLPEFFYSPNLVEYALWLLVFAVGVSLGAEFKAFSIMREMPWLLLGIPLCTILGSLAGGAAAALVLPDISVRQAMTVASGLGYYSLSSLLVEQAGHSHLAAVALLSNIFRELSGIVFAPFLARKAGVLATVAVAGAPAMDTCLPGIARYSGERAAIAAVFSGMVLTLAVPFLVTFLLHVN